MKWKYLFKDKILERGYDYYIQDKVIGYSFTDNVIKATVKGKHDYQVEVVLNKNGNIFHMFCDCPYSFEGNKCKHMSALLFYHQNKVLRQQADTKDFKYYKTLLDDMFYNTKRHNNTVDYELLVEEINQFLVYNCQKLIEDKNNYFLVLDILEYLNNYLYNFEDETYLEILFDPYKKIYETIIVNSNSEDKKNIYDKLKDQVTRCQLGFIATVLWYVILHYFDNSYIDDQIDSLKREIGVYTYGGDRESACYFAGLLASFSFANGYFNELKDVYKQFNKDIGVCYVYIKYLYEQEKYKQALNLADKCIIKIEKSNIKYDRELYDFYQIKLMSAYIIGQMDTFIETSIEFLKRYGFDEEKYKFIKDNYLGNDFDNKVKELIDYYRDNELWDSLINICLYEKRDEELAFYICQFNYRDFIKYKNLCNKYPDFILERYRREIMSALNQPYKHFNDFIINELEEMLAYDTGKDLVIDLIDMIRYRFKDNKALINSINKFYSENFLS